MKQSLRHHATLTALALWMGWSASAQAQTNWTHHPLEAVLNAFEEGWSEDGIWAPSVIRAEGDILKMWFSGGNDGFNHNRIGYAWSLDGVSWTRHPNNPVLLPEKDPVATYPHVLADGDTLRMWYSEGNFRTPDFVIRYATSTDGGATWDRHPTPVIEPGPTGSWNETAVFPGDVIKEDGLFKMWFTGGTGHFVPTTDTRYSIGYATSTDGIAWTLYDDPATTEPPFHLSDPVLLHGASSADFDWRSASSASVRGTVAGYELWYHGTQFPGAAAFGHATSPDGIEWTKYEGNPVLTAAGTPLAFELLHPSVLFYDDQYHMWLSLFGGNGPPVGYANIGYATAPLTVAVEPDAMPSGALALDPPFPNPTSAGAAVTYRLNEAAYVTLAVYDLLGREVARPIDGSRPAGEHTADWNGRSEHGRSLSAGLYVVRLRAGAWTESRTVLLLR